MIGIGGSIAFYDQKLIERFGIGLGGKLLALLRRELHKPAPALRGLHQTSEGQDFVSFQHAGDHFIDSDHEIFR